MIRRFFGIGGLEFARCFGTIGHRRERGEPVFPQEKSARLAGRFRPGDDKVSSGRGGIIAAPRGEG
jgi:hypothetical protein